MFDSHFLCSFHRNTELWGRVGMLCLQKRIWFSSFTFDSQVACNFIKRQVCGPVGLHSSQKDWFHLIFIWLSQILQFLFKKWNYGGMGSLCLQKNGFTLFTGYYDQLLAFYTRIIQEKYHNLLYVQIASSVVLYRYADGIGKYWLYRYFYAIE